MSEATSESGRHELGVGGLLGCIRQYPTVVWRPLVTGGWAVLHELADGSVTRVEVDTETAAEAYAAMLAADDAVDQ